MAANLNQLLQEAVNPGSVGLRRGGYLYKPGDKVMQIRNNYDKDVFNGDYATTIHKSQGSEYPIVVMPVLMNHYVMLQRNLVYTGITRAKKVLVMVGTKKALAYAIHNVTVEKRNTQLSERIRRTGEQGKIQSREDFLD